MPLAIPAAIHYYFSYIVTVTKIMSDPIPMTVFVSTPRPGLYAKYHANKVLARLTWGDLCRIAEINPKVTSSDIDREIIISGGGENIRFADMPGKLVVAMDTWRGSRKDALKVLEVLAHGFHDYATRETICNQGLFVPRHPRGRPSRGSSRMSGKERTRRWRERQKLSTS